MKGIFITALAELLILTRLRHALENLTIIKLILSCKGKLDSSFFLVFDLVK